jgi:hypothetical protein
MDVHAPPSWWGFLLSLEKLSLCDLVCKPNSLQLDRNPQPVQIVQANPTIARCVS